MARALDWDSGYQRFIPSSATGFGSESPPALCVLLPGSENASVHPPLSLPVLLLVQKCHTTGIFYHTLKLLHPDSDPNNPDLHSQFIQLNQAYRVLSKEGSRRLYDSQRAWHAAWPTTGSSPKHSPFDFTDLGPRPSTSSRGPDENMRYWEQFHTHHAKTFSGTQAKQRQHWNRQLFGYCLLLMLASMAAHYVAYRKLEEVHNSFMDKKDMLITSIYNESKERARANGFQKQQELLRQKHAEFTQRYRIRPSENSAQK
ncbi:dnaJ homolog subfamily C member 4 isoform X5 [Chrysemys picta bellii]|uniref:dnaJ homolog subfamily C member 4 isoform X5 n=1 Tax=Chrysemys picta bellii TaxID=8478 RepID=UPI0032B2A780